MTDRYHLENSIDVEASVERVWEAISTAEHIGRWYAFDARTEDDDSGVPKALWLSWGAGVEGTLDVIAFEPPHRLMTRDRAPEGNERPVEHAGTVEMFVEGKGGMTRLRVVTSGFKGDNWEHEVECYDAGWRLLLGTLKQYAERQWDQQCAHVVSYGKGPGPQEETWGALLDSLGVPRGAVAGDEVVIDAGGGLKLEGVVDVVAAPRTFGVVTKTGSLLRTEVAGDGSAPWAMIAHQLFGDDRANEDALRKATEEKAASLAQ